MTDNELKTDFTDRHRDFEGAWSGFLKEALLDLEMHLGAHFTQKQYQQAKLTERTLYPFNKTARQVDLIQGYEIRNRHILKIGPVGKEDDVACRQHTSIIMNQMIRGGYDTLSEAFKWGSLVEGSNLFEIWRDRDGIIRFGRRAFNAFLLNPSFTRSDLSDCRDILTGQWLNKDDITRLLPADSDKISKIPTMESGRWVKTNRLDDLRLYEEWWRQETEFTTMVINRLNGEEIPLKQFNKHPRNKELLDLRSPNGAPVFSKYKKDHKVVKLTAYVDNEPVWDGYNPLGLDEYNFVWLGGEWVPECERDELKLRSFTRRLRMPQHARDKRLNQAIDILESQINSGKIIREKSLVSNEDAYKTGQGQVIFVKSGFQGTNAEAVSQLMGAPIPSGVFQLIEILDREETQATGLNNEIFGSDDKDISGIVHKYRTGQALTAQQGIFQGYRRAKWQTGIKLVKANQQFLSPQRVFRMINEYPAQEFYVPDMTMFDCTPTEGLLTDSQRHLWYAELKALQIQFSDVISASDVVEAAPVQYSREMLEKIKKSEQMKQQMMQAQLQTKQAMDSMLQAQAQEDLAQAQERRSSAFLDKAKAMVEVQKISAEPKFGLLDRYIQVMQLMQNNQGGLNK